MCLCASGATEDLLLPVISQHPPLKVAMGHEGVRRKAQLSERLIQPLLGNGLGTTVCRETHPSP